MRVFHLVFEWIVLSAPLLAGRHDVLVGAAEMPTLEDKLWENAISYMKEIADEEGSDDVISRLVSKDITTVHQVAKHMLKQDKKKFTAMGVEILQALATHEENPHISSQVALGFHYAGQQQSRTALKYFESAGNSGPHQAALYNAGRIHSDLKEYVPAMAYIRAAARLPKAHPASDEKLTATCREAFQMLCHQLAQQSHDLLVAADLFIQGNLDHDLTENQEYWWRNAVEGMSTFQETMIESSGAKQDREAMEKVISNLRLLWEKSSSGAENEQLSPFQAFLMLQYMNHMLSLMSALDESYVPAAAGYAEALATLPDCYYAAARSEDEDTEQSCFNGAASRAVVYYNRAGDTQSAQRIMDFAKQHESAATKWERIDQTPRVYHPELKAQPFWEDLSIFPIVTALQRLYTMQSATILAELKDVKNLEEGFEALDDSKVVGEAEVSADGSIKESNKKKKSKEPAGFQRIFNPQIGVRTTGNETQDLLGGAGAWAEYGPLYDGRDWSNKCRFVPTLCQAIQRNDGDLCIRKNDIAKRATPAEAQATLARACGTTNGVASIFRLRPGSRILPHSGSTNGRLMLHFCLEGCQGVEMTVGDDTVKNYGGDGAGGAAIVYDDSFVNSAYNGDSEDAIVLQVALAHPGQTK